MGQCARYFFRTPRTTACQKARLDRDNLKDGIKDHEITFAKMSSRKGRAENMACTGIFSLLHFLLCISSSLVYYMARSRIWGSPHCMQPVFRMCSILGFFMQTNLVPAFWRSFCKDRLELSFFVLHRPHSRCIGIELEQYSFTRSPRSVVLGKIRLFARPAFGS